MHEHHGFPGCKPERRCRRLGGFPGYLATACEADAGATACAADAAGATAFLTAPVTATCTVAAGDLAWVGAWLPPPVRLPLEPPPGFAMLV